MKYIKVHPIKNTPPFRKIAIGTWTNPGDPQIYGTIELDLTKVNEWLENKRDLSTKITITHIVAKAIAVTMKKYPDLNGLIRFGRIYLRETVDLFFQAVVKHPSGRDDLAGVLIKEVEKKSVSEIANEMNKKLERLREKKDTEIQRTSKMMSLIPGFLIKFVLKIISFIAYTLNIRIPGLPEDQFGSCMISNVGSLGLDMAYAPLVPYSRVPMIILIGRVEKRPVVINNKIEIREMVRLNATIDHRFCDGSLIAKMVKSLKKCFEEPEKYLE